MPGIHRISIEEDKPMIAGAVISTKQDTNEPLIELYEAPIIKIESKKSGEEDGQESDEEENDPDKPTD